MVKAVCCLCLAPVVLLLFLFLQIRTNISPVAYYPSPTHHNYIKSVFSLSLPLVENTEWKLLTVFLLKFQNIFCSDFRYEIGKVSYKMQHVLMLAERKHLGREFVEETKETKLCCEEIIKTICSAPRRPSSTSLWKDCLLFLTIIRLLIVEIDFPKCQTVPGELPVFLTAAHFADLTAAMLLCAVRGAGNERKRRQQKYEICSKNMLRDVWCLITASAYYTICTELQHLGFFFYLIYRQFLTFPLCICQRLTCLLMLVYTDLALVDG